MKNNKGFTLVEILTAVTILGILSALAIAGYTRYIEYAKKQSYNTMAKSMSTAAEQYIIDNPGDYMETEVVDTAEGKKYVFKDEETFTTTFGKLVEDGYISGAQDPTNKSTDCRGYVRIGLVKGEGKDALDQYIYQIDECCANYSARYTYTYVKDSNGKIKSKEEVDTTVEKSTMCPDKGRFTIATINCGESEEQTYYFKHGMNVVEWAHSNYAKSIIDEEISWYDEDNESNRNYIKNDLANRLYRQTSDCYSGGYGYGYGYGYGPFERRNLEGETPDYESCPPHVLEDGEVITFSYGCPV